MLVLDHQIKHSRSLKLLSFGVLIGLLILGVRLWHVQMVAFKKYQVDLNRQSFRMVRMPAIRGAIFDRNGIPLVDNRLSFQLKLYLEDIRQQFQDAYAEARRDYARRHGHPIPTRDERLALGKQTRYQVASNISFQVSAHLGKPRILDDNTFQNHYQRKQPLPMPIMEDLTTRQLSVFLENTRQFPGVGFEIQAVRTNHYQSLAAHVLGYVRRNVNPDPESEYHFHYLLPDHRGAPVGIEGVFDEELRGEAGAKRIIINNYGYRQEERILQAPKPGKNIYLTLNLPVQMTAEKALRSSSVTTKGAVVVVDVRNGDLLAIASSPTFDPNWFVAPLAADSEEWQYFINTDLRPQINRATMGFYQPGSTFKMIVGLACMKENVLDPEERFYSKGYYRINPRSRPIGDTAPAGNYDFERAFKLSSNTYFIEFGLRAGRNDILKMAYEFGLNEKTGIPIHAEHSGFLPEIGASRKRNGAPWRHGDTCNLCIGQGDIIVTPIQMAMLTAAIANGGDLYEPRLVTRIVPQNAVSNEEIRMYLPRVKNRVAIPPRDLRVLHEAMRADVRDGYATPGGTGSGYKAEVPGMEICGKTGTAEVKDSTQDDKVAWFTSFAPLSSPKYAVVVAIESGASGGDACAPVARKIYEELQKQEQLKAAQRDLTLRN